MATPARATSGAAAGPPAARTSRHPLVGEVGRRLSGRCGVPAGAKVLVAVSGGADSVALLAAAAALAGRRGRTGAGPIEPAAVHVNHHLRDGADDDETFVAGLCDHLGIPLQTRHVDPGRLPGNRAANARRLRYRELESAAVSAGARFVAVAHHAEDQLETMLMALGRGAGLEGLRGMSWRRALGSVSLVRPLLAVRKATCEAFCRWAGVTWRQDPTNADPRTVRGRLRRDVMGVFEELWPDAAIRAGRAAELIGAAAVALDRELGRAFGDPGVRQWSRDAIGQQEIGVIAAGLRRAAIAAAPAAAGHLGSAQLLPAAEAIADRQRRPRTFQWPRGLSLRVTAREVLLLGPPPAA